VDGALYPQFNSPEFNAEYASYQQAVMDKLNGTSPEEFTPSLSALDDLLESLQVDLVAVPKASPPPGALSVPCLNALPTRLRVGLFAYVDPDPPLPNNVRSDAGRDNDLIGEIGPGQAMKIMDGPKCADGWVWWQVRALEIKLEGWTAEGDQQEYWLIPCALQAQCGP